jgi:hypothetical protein
LKDFKKKKIARCNMREEKRRVDEMKWTKRTENVVQESQRREGIGERGS